MCCVVWRWKEEEKWQLKYVEIQTVAIDVAKTIVCYGNRSIYTIVVVYTIETSLHAEGAYCRLAIIAVRAFTSPKHQTFTAGWKRRVSRVSQFDDPPQEVRVG
jgi:hypothetical protein